MANTQYEEAEDLKEPQQKTAPAQQDGRPQEERRSGKERRGATTVGRTSISLLRAAMSDKMERRRAVASRGDPPRIVAGGSITNRELNSLFGATWVDHEPRDFKPILARSLVYLTVREGTRLIGFVNVVSDGGCHAFLLDPTVHPSFRRRGIGTRLLQDAAHAARAHGAEWLHVDFEQKLERFYVGAGFRLTAAAVWNLTTGA